ncbi:MAG: DUF4493 domain-containing protein [Muribaculaceae bacterium]|nr:DUF4493 domain-containing protein [Muribaculaceae bacterium]
MKIKSILYKGALLSMALIGMTACNEESKSLVAPDGHLNLKNLGVEVTGTGRATVDVSNFIVDICQEGKETPVKTFAFKNMPSVVDLTPGEYYIDVRSHNLEKAEWDNPYYTGKSEKFEIIADDVTDVEPIKCVFSSLKVSVVFGPKLLKKIGNDVTVTVVANDEGRLVYAPDDNREGYFATIDGSTTLVAVFSGTVNGHKEEFSRTYTDVAAGQHRTITYEVGNDVPEPDAPTGSVDQSQGINVDVSYVDVDLINADVTGGNEDIIPDPGEKPGQLPALPDEGEEPSPEKPDEGNTTDPDEPKFSFEGSTLENGKSYMTTDFTAANPAKLVINCPDGIASAAVTIDSTFLTPDELEGVGLSDKFDLCNDEALFEALQGLGFPAGDQIKNQTTATIEITGFMDLLAIGGTSTSKFTFVVTDSKGVVKTTQFSINVE